MTREQKMLEERLWKYYTEEEGKELKDRYNKIENKDLQSLLESITLKSLELGYNLAVHDLLKKMGMKEF